MHTTYSIWLYIIHRPGFPFPKKPTIVYDYLDFFPRPVPQSWKKPKQKTTKSKQNKKTNKPNQKTTPKKQKTLLVKLWKFLTPTERIILNEQTTYLEYIRDSSDNLSW